MKPKVKLIGEDGNALMLIAKCRQAMKEAEYSASEIDEITHRMMSGDYDHLLQVVVEEFEVE